MGGACARVGVDEMERDTAVHVPIAHERDLMFSVAAELGVTFTVACDCNMDRFPNDSETLKRVTASALWNTSLEGETTWLCPPEREAGKLIEYYLQCKARSAFSTSACIVVPERIGASLSRTLQRMLRVQCSALEGTGLAAFYDPPLVRLAAKSADAGNALIMRFWSQVGEAPAVALVDTGATCSIMSEQFAVANGIKVRPAVAEVLPLGGSALPVVGRANGDVTIGGRTAHVQFVVMPMEQQFDVLLGQDFCAGEKVSTRFIGTPGLEYPDGHMVPCAAANTLPLPGESPFVGAVELSQLLITSKDLPKAQQAEVCLVGVRAPDGVCTSSEGGEDHPEIANIKKEMASVFEELKRPPPERAVWHTIETEPGARPPCLPVRRQSPLERAEVEAQVKKLLDLGFIRPSNSPYGAPVLFVKKPDGSLRMCIDYRALNKITVKNKYPLPRIDVLLDHLAGAQWFSTLDLAQGYHQVRVTQQDIPKTAFRTHMGSYEYIVLPFGLTNAPATFQAVMNDMFRGHLYKFVLVYLDDILIFSRNFEDHCKHLRLVLQKLMENQFYCKLEKCSFARRSVKFLGHIVEGGCVKADPAKCKAVLEWPTPKTATELRSFMGLATYFRKFVQGFAAMASPLHTLLKGEAVWNWTVTCAAAFQGIKERLTSPPTLRMPDPQSEEPFRVVCDASMNGTGAVLFQGGHPCAYDSHKFGPAERNYAPGDQELLAVIRALSTWRCFLEGAKVRFTLVTDHHPLVFLSTVREPTRRQTRWLQFLQGFDFEWKYEPGRTNVADPLSRKPDLVAVLTHQYGTRSRKVAQVLVQRQKRKRPGGNADVIPAQDSSPAMADEADVSDEVVAMEDALEALHAAPFPSVAAVGDDFHNKVASEQAADSWLKVTKNTRALCEEGGLWYKGSALYIPESMRLDCLRECHDDPFAGHMGVPRTINLLLRYYWWPTLRADAEQYVKTCNSCQRVKARNLRPGGLLQPLEVPVDRWHTVSMDFITDLPVVANGMDCILVVVDKLTKLVVLIPCAKSSTAEDVAHMLLERVFCVYGFPRKIVSDRDARFNSMYFKGWAAALGIHLAMSTAYHPETDGQTERFNRVVEDVLRHYVSPGQTDWARHLPCVQWAMNNSVHSATKNTPFFLNAGWHPPRPGGLRLESRVPAVAAFVKGIGDAVLRTRTLLQAARDRMKTQVDSHRRPVVFEEGESVLLSSKNFTFKSGGVRKLMPRFIGPFKIVARVGEVAYRLQLPAEMKVHDVFHVSLLQPYRSDGRYQPPPPVLYVDGEPEYEVAAILEKRIVRGRVQYLVSWKDYGPEHDTWEPASGLTNASAVVADFERAQSER